MISEINLKFKFKISFIDEVKHYYNLNEKI